VLCRAKEQMLLQGCLAAFGEAAVYFGGPHDLNNPGLARGPEGHNGLRLTSIASKQSELVLLIFF
jgi:hypothetical protein